jgi:hypothetical protein
MIAAMLVFLGPTVGRIGPILLGWSEVRTQNIQYIIVYTILIGLLVYDRESFKKRQPYLVAIAFFIIHQLTFYFTFA